MAKVEEERKVRCDRGRKGKGKKGRGLIRYEKGGVVEEGREREGRQGD